MAASAALTQNGRYMGLPDISSLGVAGALVIIVLYLLMQFRSDRKQRILDDEADQTRVDRMQARIDKLVADLEAERTLRRKAEDDTDNLRREVRALQSALDSLTKRDR